MADLPCKALTIDTSLSRGIKGLNTSNYKNYFSLQLMKLSPDMLLECSCPAHHLPSAGGALLQVGSAGPAHDVAAVALVDLVPRPELVVAHLQHGFS